MTLTFKESTPALVSSSNVFTSLPGTRTNPEHAFDTSVRRPCPSEPRTKMVGGCDSPVSTSCKSKHSTSIPLCVDAAAPKILHPSSLAEFNVLGRLLVEYIWLNSKAPADAALTTGEGGAGQK